ncbi:MAG: chemotaxis protein CheA, partial [Planctomycetota bacterium]
EFCESFSHAIERLKAGEAIDAESTRELEEGLEWIRQQSELWESNRASFSKLDEAIDQLARISDSLQRGVLGTRMVPIGPLLNRFRRIVRDLSLQFSKEVTLTLEGESTELDKRMIDALSDPITHLIRNSLDHGLESPQERAEAGKPERGTIVLAARHSGNQVSIIVRDDGRGISADRIRDSLVNKKLMSRAQADAMSEDDAIASIFHPGFSTASQITNVSGRGVGMDIVKATITELNGTIDIDTCVGRGTTFTIQLPLTLAIIGSLLFRMGRVTFAVPKDDVREIVSIHPDQIVEVHGKRTFQVRGVYLPLIRITDVLRFHDETVCARDDSQSQPRPTEIAILHAADQVIGLQVDQCVGSQDVVIKSLAENLTYLPGLAGASILGDGTVALMLDVASLPRLLARTTDPQQAIA